LGEILSTFWHALYLDTSLACYFLGFSFLCFSLYAILPVKIFLIIHKIYIILLLVVFSLIVIAELEIYKEWGSKLSVKAIRFLEHPMEVIDSTTTFFLVAGLMGAAALAFFGYYVWKRISSPQSMGLDKETVSALRKVVGIVVFVSVVPTMLFMGIRGGIQQIPIQQSDAYFSKHNILNLAAVNSGWNLGQSIWENKKIMDGNPYVYYSPNEARKTIEEIYQTNIDVK